MLASSKKFNARQEAADDTASNTGVSVSRIGPRPRSKSGSRADIAALCVCGARHAVDMGTSGACGPAHAQGIVMRKVLQC